MKYQNRVLSLLSLLAILTYLDRVCISVAGPRMQDALHISPEQWGWVTGIFTLAYAAFEFPTGILGDRIGPRRVLTRVVLWWSAFTSLTAAATNYSVLLATRFCFGIGEAGAYPNVASVIARWFPPQKRGRAWGVVWCMSQLGGALSPILVVPIQFHYGWGASFVTFGFLGVLWTIIWFRWFRDRPSEMPRVPPAERQEIGVRAPHADHRIKWGGALRSGNAWRLMAIGGLYCYAIAFYQSWLHTFLVKGRGFGENDLILSSLPYIVGAAANLLGGFLTDRAARAFGLRAARAGFGCAALSISALSLIGAVATASHTLVLVFLSLTYGGMTFQQSVFSAVAIDVAPRNAGAMMGMGNTAANAGAVISQVAFGYIVSWFGNYNAPLIPMAIALAAGAILWLGVDPAVEVFPHPKTESIIAAA